MANLATISVSRTINKNLGLSQPISHPVPGNGVAAGESLHNGHRGAELERPTKSSATKQNAKLAIYEPVATELVEVSQLIEQQLHSAAADVDELLGHARGIGGKQMRPVMLLLCGKALGQCGPSHITLAAAVEMVHLATLVHDDVIDKAESRRHQQTAHQKWGNKTSVLLGDFLFTHAFSLAATTGSSEAVQMIAAASNQVCEGEIKQNLWQHKFSITEAEYLTMISQKTGELVAAACGMGALQSGADSDAVAAFSSFGRKLGAAFQIVDDVLDLVGDSKQVGKTLGTDLVNGKLTLPLIHALKWLDEPDRSKLLEQLQAEQPHHAAVVELLAKSDSIQYARQVARSLADDAISFAQSLGDNPSAAALVNTARFILARSH